MKFLLTEEFVKIPDGVKVSVKARVVTIEGPRGKIVKNFKHVACDFKTATLNLKARKGKHVHIQMWFGRYKQTCQVNTLAGIIKNMFIGVTKGFVYKMRTVNNHFPINAGIAKDGKSIEIKNYLGGKARFNIKLFEGCKVENSKFLKDELIFTGIDNQGLAQSCAQISQCCDIGRKDDRKFLDGVYVQYKGLIDE